MSNNFLSHDARIREARNPDMFRRLWPHALDFQLCDVAGGYNFPMFLTWADFFMAVGVELRTTLKSDKEISGLAREWTPTFRVTVDKGGDQRVVEFGERDEARAFVESPYAWAGSNPRVHTIGADGSTGELVACSLDDRDPYAHSNYTPIVATSDLPTEWQENGTLSIPGFTTDLFSNDCGAQMLHFLAKYLTVGVDESIRPAAEWDGSVRDGLTALAQTVTNPSDFLTFLASHEAKNPGHLTLGRDDTIFAIYPTDAENGQPYLSSYATAAMLKGQDATVRRVDLGRYTGPDTHTRDKTLNPADFEKDETLYMSF